jgi:glycosyltransferase involved in cell wall biosynthesis
MPSKTILAKSSNVSFFLASLRGGGAERVMLTIINELASSGAKVTLILLRAEGPYLNKIHKSVKVVNIGRQRTILSLPFMVHYFRKNKPDVVISALPHINMVTCWAQRISRIKSKTIITEHNTLSRSVKYSTTIRGRWLPFFMKLTYPLADTVVAVSNGVADDLSNMLKLPRADITVVYNPVVSDFLVKSSQKKIDHAWLESERTPVILGVGRLTEAKNFATLIKAFSILVENIPAKLIILGEGKQRGHLENIIKQLNLTDKVDLPGFIENPYPFMKKCELFVLSSIWEGLPTVLIEALSLGAKVISTDCHSGPREILEDGKWGTLVPINNVNSLAQAMLDSLQKNTNPAESEAWQKYTVQNVISRYQQLIF